MRNHFTTAVCRAFYEKSGLNVSGIRQQGEEILATDERNFVIGRSELTDQGGTIMHRDENFQILGYSTNGDAWGVVHRGPNRMPL
ncbi:MAG: hypothetical protein IT558_05865 [Alphaproteobacteria bacterium]|nr:hypothetical protein [Alphaproteobacteria bacterium]